jgi:hypothetical protein
MSATYLSLWIEAWRAFLTLWQVRPSLAAERRPRTEPWWVFLSRWQRTTLLGMGRARNPLAEGTWAPSHILTIPPRNACAHLAARCRG